MALTSAQQWQAYLSAIKTDFTKLCKLEFLQPDGSVAFALDNSHKNRRSKAFIQDGSISANLNNGQRRSATVTLSNLDAAYDNNVNKIWFGQQLRLNEGLMLPDGTDFYLPQGVFYIKDPTESMYPSNRTVTYPLVDKWAYLDGSLFGKLETIYEIPYGSSIFDVVASILLLPQGNGYVIDNVPPLFTNWYNGKTQLLPDGTTANLTDTPYTYRADSDGGAYSDILLAMNTMLAGWIGYDQTGALRMDPSQDDILDSTKPILYEFTPTEKQLCGANYTAKNSEMYNDVIIQGASGDDYAQVGGRAQNLDSASDTNVNLVGRKTYRETQSGYATNRQCEDLAEFKLKRMTTLQKSVNIESAQMFHLIENNLVTVRRTDKQGTPVERHLITGFTRPLATTGSMTIQAVSTNDFPIATITSVTD
jgi:hypothetical protein